MERQLYVTPCSSGVCTVQYTVCTFHHRVCTVYHTVCTVQHALCTVCHIVCIVHYAVRTVQHTIYTLHEIGCTFLDTVYTVHCTLYCTLLSALCHECCMEWFYVCKRVTTGILPRPSNCATNYITLQFSVLNPHAQSVLSFSVVYHCTVLISQCKVVVCYSIVQCGKVQSSVKRVVPRPQVAEVLPTFCT